MSEINKIKDLIGDIQEKGMLHLVLVNDDNKIPITDMFTIKKHVHFINSNFVDVTELVSSLSVQAGTYY